MDKMCQKPEAHDLNKTITKAAETENARRCESPVFKCVNQTKHVRGNHLNSSDCDISSYQIFQSTRNITSNKYENNTTEPVLSFNAMFSPIPTDSVSKFQPSLNSLGTVIKNLDKTCQKRISSLSNINRIDSCKPCGTFESLGMTDKDISWVSSMASPPPRQISRSEFNTIEKATFLPEEKFQCIQPRALFSPAFDDDFGCHPITFTSESDNDDVDDENKEYKSNIRLSDVCATLKQLEVKSLDQPLDSTVEKTIIEEDCLISPVIQTGKKKKLENVKKKNKVTLIISPNNKYQFSLGENVKASDYNKIKPSDGNNFIEDDSFQSISFSCIDELCKTLVTEQSCSSLESKCNSCDETCVNNINIHSKPNSSLKKFYSTRIATEIHAVSSMDNLHSYAIALEEGDKYILGDNKIDPLFTDKGIVRFDIFNKDFSETDTPKQLHSEVTLEKDVCNEKKFKKVDDLNSSWEKAKQYLSESQLNVSDGEIFRTVEHLEKTLAIQKSKEMESLIVRDSLGGEVLFSQNSDVLNGSSENSGDKNQEIDKMSSKCSNDLETSRIKLYSTKRSSQNILAVPLTAFTTASGSKISVSKKALNKAQEILKDCTENLENVESQKLMDGLNRSDEPIQVSKATTEVAGGAESILMKGFLTGSGKQIKISSEALEKAKAFMSEFETSARFSENSTEKIQVQYTEETKEKAWENLKERSGGELQISNETLKEAEFSILTCDEGSEQCCNDIKSSVKGFSTVSGKEIQFSVKALQKAKAFMVDCLEKEEMISVKGFMTSSGKPIQVSSHSLEKARAILSECDENFKENSTSISCQNQNSINSFKKPPINDCDENLTQNPTLQGFLTGSGKNIPISSEALEKAKSFMKNCELKLSENPQELDSVWIKEVTNQAFRTCEEQKTETNINNDDNRKLQTREDNLMNSTTDNSDVLGQEVKDSSKVLAEANTSLTKSDEILSEVAESLVKIFSQIEPSFTGFETAGGTKITVSAAALAKAKEKMIQWNQNKFEDCENCDCTTNSVKTPVKNVSETETSRLSTTSGINESDDWDEIIPNWLQVYSTSPSLASTGIEISHETGESLQSVREYIVKSPVLGSGDRFYGKKKKRKLRFEENSKSQDENQLDFITPRNEVWRKNSLKRTLNVSLDFRAPFKKMKFVEDARTVDLDVKAQRALAREEQEKIIKEKQKVKPVKGSYLSRKCSEKQMSWMEAVAGSSPEVNSDEFLKSFGIVEEILQINVENAVSFKFNGEHFFGSSCEENVKGVPMGDRFLVILDDENRFGVEEIKRAFLASPGVQPNLVPNTWIENHYKWIVWKLAHYERSFPQHFGGRCLTPNHVMLQLKYRYDREIDRNERSALKKILEKDDMSIKRLVLCVCGIKKIHMGYELSLTDGWYSCPARTDSAMTKFIEEGKISIGTKLMIQGAVLVNCEQGVSPLEISDDVHLKISTNSTRRIRWDTKLGFQKNPKNFPISLGSILPQGGPISRIDVIIVRIYPVLYMENTLDGHHVTRNRRSEEKADAEYRRIREQRMEIILKEIQSEMRKSANSEKYSLNFLADKEDVGQFLEASSALEVNNLSQTKKVFGFLSESGEVEEMGLHATTATVVKNLLSADQRNPGEFQLSQSDCFNQEMAEKIEKKLEKEKLNKRNVSEFLRAKIVDFRKPDYNNTALLTVWNPNEDVTALLSEGKIISLMNVNISNSSRMCKPLQINTTRQTQFRQISKNVKYPTRKLTKLKDVSSKVCPAFEEVDLVGIVALVQDVSYGSRLAQIVYLTDLEMNFVKIVFWGCCKDFGWENVLKISSVVACINLQWKKNHTLQVVPSLFVNENSLFTENPRHGYLKEEMERLKENMPQNLAAFLSKCKEDVTMKLEESKSSSNTGNISINDPTFKETELTKFRGVNGFESKPTASSTPIKPFTAKISSEAEPSPIQKKIEKLQAYGEPPSLIPLIVRNNANRKFKKKS